MKFEQKKDLPHGCRLLYGVTKRDDRGALTFVECNTLPFAIKRIFWITGVPEGKHRGGHAHSSCSEAVFVVSGAFTMHLSDGESEADVRLTAPESGVLVPRGVWCELRDFTADCICVVAASEPYNQQGYFNTYEEYLKHCAAHKSEL